jgi:carboxypeptidase C (cathepsin A)
MIGLFQENGPCKFELGTHDTGPFNNTFSWNNNVNMLYIDQPVQVGFSLGTNATSSTEGASPYVWRLIQAFYAAFPEYKSRDLGIFTESYGGHYGAHFAKYIQVQNKVKAGEHVNLVALGINNGWHDSMLQEPAYIDFALNNSYRPLITPEEHQEYHHQSKHFCLPKLLMCDQTGSNSDCVSAKRACYLIFLGPLGNRPDFNLYDIRKSSDDEEPPRNYVKYLQNPHVLKAIGAR